MNESKIIVFLRHVWWSAGKERLRRENEIKRGRRRLRSQFEN